jgi:hypothetical protein
VKVSEVPTGNRFDQNPDYASIVFRFVTTSILDMKQVALHFSKLTIFGLSTAQKPARGSLEICVVPFQCCIYDWTVTDLAVPVTRTMAETRSCGSGMSGEKECPDTPTQHNYNVGVRKPARHQSNKLTSPIKIVSATEGKDCDIDRVVETMMQRISIQRRELARKQNRKYETSRSMAIIAFKFQFHITLSHADSLISV